MQIGRLLFERITGVSFHPVKAQADQLPRVRRRRIERRSVFDLSDAELSAAMVAEAYTLEESRIRDLLNEASSRLIAKAIDLAETTD